MALSLLSRFHSTISVLCIFAFANVSNAQLDSVPIGSVVYNQQISLSGDKDNNGFSILLFNSQNSVYIHGSTPPNTVVEKGDEQYVSRVTPGDKEGFPIYKDHVTRKAYAKKTASGLVDHRWLITVDTFGAIEWELHPERKMFGDYECRRATGIFGGRHYEAWYTPEIPIGSGPHKLGGLPGLILEAYTTDNKVHYQFVALELGKNTPGVIKMPSGQMTDMTYVQYMRKSAERMKELEKAFNARGDGFTYSFDVSRDTIEIWEEKK